MIDRARLTSWSGPSIRCLAKLYDLVPTLVQLSLRVCDQESYRELHRVSWSRVEAAPSTLRRWRVTRARGSEGRSRSRCRRYLSCVLCDHSLATARRRLTALRLRRQGSRASEGSQGTATVSVDRIHSRELIDLSRVPRSICPRSLLCLDAVSVTRLIATLLVSTVS